MICLAAHYMSVEVRQVTQQPIHSHMYSQSPTLRAPVFKEATYYLREIFVTWAILKIAISFSIGYEEFLLTYMSFLINKKMLACKT